MENYLQLQVRKDSGLLWSEVPVSKTFPISDHEMKNSGRTQAETALSFAHTLVNIVKSDVRLSWKGSEQGYYAYYNGTDINAIITECDSLKSEYEKSQIDCDNFYTIYQKAQDAFEKVAMEFKCLSSASGYVALTRSAQVLQECRGNWHTMYETCRFNREKWNRFAHKYGLTVTADSETLFGE